MGSTTSSPQHDFPNDTTDADALASSLTYISFETQHDQAQSRLFQLPGEVRQNIYHYALASYEDADQPYEKNTYWFRPEYSARKKCDTTLLLTCKRIYDESWHVPWMSMDHTFWLTNNSRAPEKRMSKHTFARVLELIHSMHGDIDFNHVRFFSQLYMLEPGDHLSEFLDMPHFRPKCVTVTLRHTDWWHWEGDQQLRISADWVRSCTFPDSVRSIRLELESLERKKVQIDSILQQMKEQWRFKRSDNVMLTATKTPVEVMRWKGSSMWHSRRWVRDETEVETLSYYVATITFKQEPDVQTVSNHNCPALHSQAAQFSIISHRPSLSAMELVSARVPLGTPADQATYMVDDLYRQAAPAAGATLFRLGTGVPPSQP